ncbi:uncharacterized protein LOC128852429 isoform X2 [Cuculus canorus]|uniref:uncharacterized protein LOC128852429 isoform X2 n=1 Tax=Cuculus canorus TaxID=55661 RepID=UPI0023AAE722|nr:uncharacterized protein LOC128852429 isoform X2 [Cuculus canorus]
MISYPRPHELRLKKGGQGGQCCRPPDHEEVCDVLQAAGRSFMLAHPVSQGDLNHPEVCWKGNTAGCKQSREFLENFELLVVRIHRPLQNPGCCILLGSTAFPPLHLSVMERHIQLHCEGSHLLCFRLESLQAVKCIKRSRRGSCAAIFTRCSLGHLGANTPHVCWLLPDGAQRRAGLFASCQLRSQGSHGLPFIRKNMHRRTQDDNKSKHCKKVKKMMEKLSREQEEQKRVPLSSDLIAGISSP